MSWGDEEEIFKECVGLKVEAVTANPERAIVKFHNGRVLTLELEGDCCSHSYFQDPSQFSELQDSIIIEIESRHQQRDGNKYESTPSDDSVSWHFLVFKTSRGHVDIDWRNDANGYYDGSVVARLD
jgi:hypothetical protein